MGTPAPNLKDAQSPGQAAYEAYAASLDWKSGVSGAPLPEWASEKVTENIKKGWEAAAFAARDFFDALAQAKAA